MSDIDQAFINAYADQPVRAAARPRNNDPTGEIAPTLRVFAHAGEVQASEHRIDQPQRVMSPLQPPHVGGTFSATYVEVAAQQQSQHTTAVELTLPSLVAERKPLSTFAAPKAAPAPAFKPVFEVDSFRWPQITNELITTARPLLHPVIDLLVTSSVGGRTLVGIGGANVGAGTSTVTLCLARLLATSGHSVALVDSNFVKGDLARTLGLEFDLGWEDVLAGQIPLAECAVASLADRMTLIPLGSSAEANIDRLISIQSSVVAGMLRYHYDFVLFDLGSASDPAQDAAIRSIIGNCRLDVGLVVATVGARDPVTIHGIEQLTAAFGANLLGVIGNRAS